MDADESGVEAFYPSDWIAFRNSGFLNYFVNEMRLECN